ncbi:MAG TPA: dihydroorotase [Verrucomicrobiae bacterium]|jgi:dihydroorotase|nr:dihydroorotase [Verrucomicrobiae bacterium]
MNFLIRGAHVVDPASKLDGVMDIQVQNGKIVKIAKTLEAQGAEVIEGKGQHLFPGFIDLHTHFREPGFEAKETIQTGAMAALKGGYVASVSMPNTDPPCDQQSVVDNILRKAREVGYHIFPSGTISKGRLGKELTEMADLKRAGIVAVTDDGDWVADSLLMRRAMEYASMLGLIVMSHCEDRRLSAKGVMNEGLSSTKLGLRGIPPASEEIAVARDIELARYTGARLHVCHVSTARSVELIRRAKSEGIPVTTEVTPHNLTLTDEELEGYNTNCKMYPPLRTEEDVKVIRKALKDGTIDCISTDHAPHTQEEKMAQFDEAPFGTIGLETALGVVLTTLYHEEKWTLKEIVRMMSTRPAEILGIQSDFGGVREGMTANLTLVDLERGWTVLPEELRSKSRNSCFMKKQLKGRVAMTFCGGKLWRF